MRQEKMYYLVFEMKRHFENQELDVQKRGYKITQMLYANIQKCNEECKNIYMI